MWSPCSPDPQAGQRLTAIPTRVQDASLPAAGLGARTLHPIQPFFFNLQSRYRIEDSWYREEMGVGEDRLATIS